MSSRNQMKTAKNTEIARGWNSRKKRNLTANDRQEVKLRSQKPNKDGNESQTHDFSNALLHCSVRKVEIVLMLSQKVIQSRISVFFAVFIWFLDGIVRIVVFLVIHGWTGHDESGTQRGAPNSSIFIFNFWSKDPPWCLRILPVGAQGSFICFYFSSSNNNKFTVENPPTFLNTLSVMGSTSPLPQVVRKIQFRSLN